MNLYAPLFPHLKSQVNNTSVVITITSTRDCEDGSGDMMPQVHPSQELALASSRQPTEDTTFCVRDTAHAHHCPRKREGWGPREAPRSPPVTLTPR